MTVNRVAIVSGLMTRESFYTIRKFLVRARVANHTEEEEFFRALQALDRMILANAQRRAEQKVAE